MPRGDNLPDRDFTARQANQAYVGDIAYVRAREGRLHLAVVIGLSSRQAVGWPMAGPIPTGHLWPLVTSAGIVGERCVADGDLGTQTPERPALARRPDSQYAATSHRKTTKRFGIRQSMGRKGNCWGSLPLGYNAVAGSFFHALKTEPTHRQTFRNREEAKQAVSE